MQLARWSSIAGMGLMILSCASTRSSTSAPDEAFAWSSCKQQFNSEKGVAHTCDEYMWVRFPRPAGDHGKVVAQASAREGEKNGWTAQSWSLPAETVPSAQTVSAIVFHSREAADSLIKVSIIASRDDDRFATGHAVTVCSREYDLYKEPIPDQTTAVAQVSSICGAGAARLAGL